MMVDRIDHIGRGQRLAERGGRHAEGRVLGIDPGTTVPDKTGRPVGISHGGQPIFEILS